ncbi:MAG: Lrp/AsnC family transcriptional regulator [Gammaproteobacteria bacterium]
MNQLDSKDQLLIASLRKNARASLVSLAKDINLSRSATHDRINRLESKGVIKGYTVVLDKLAQPTKAVFFVSIVNGDPNPLIAEKINKLRDVTGSQCLSGEIDLLVQAACPDTNRLAELRDEISGLKGVSRVKTQLVLAENGV